MCSGNAIIAVLEERLSDWRRWGLSAEPHLLKTFTEGQNHHTALIEAGETRWVLKVFQHSFDQAIAAQRWAADLAVSPAIQFAEGDLALIEYVASDQYIPQHLPTIAASLKRLHNAPSPGWVDFDLIAFCDHYLTTADQSVLDWHHALIPALHVFINDPTPWCACHNDLVMENCLSNDHRTVFIDWEYAMQHNPWFDLAAIVLYFGLDADQSRVFLAHYQSGWERKIDQPIFHASQLALLWGDLLWHMNKLGLDYRTEKPQRFVQLKTLATHLGIELPPQTQ